MPPMGRIVTDKGAAARATVEIRNVFSDNRIVTAAKLSVLLAFVHESRTFVIAGS
jgi:hypothetical protein